MRILYIEDNASNAAFLDRVIQMSGDQLDTYDSAEEALANADLRAYDVIITDIHLGENVMDGLDFTARIRQSGINTPVIAVTAFDFDEYERRSAEVGSDVYLVKPVPPQTVVDLLNQFRP